MGLRICGRGGGAGGTGLRMYGGGGGAGGHRFEVR